jgi:hypothetical protein
VRDWLLGERDFEEREESKEGEDKCKEKAEDQRRQYVGYLTDTRD